MITDKRLKEITHDLYRIIEILCNNNDKNVDEYVSRYTNLTDQEKEMLFMNKKRDL